MREASSISRISASGYNSAAFNCEDNFWLWGGSGRGKMGLTSISKDYSEPTFVQFEVVRKYQDTPEEETFLEPFID